MIYRALNITVVVIFLLLPRMVGGEPPVQFSARVQLTITADDEVKRTLESYLTRELRELQGVSIVDSKPQHVIEIVAFKTKNVGSHVHNGYAISTVFLEPFDNESFSELVTARYIKSKTDSDPKGLLARWTSGLYEVGYHDLRVTDIDSLRKECDDLVILFDSKELEPRRKTLQRLNDIRSATK